MVGKTNAIASTGNDDVLASLIDRSITSINIPNEATEIGGYSFYKCSNLKSVTIPNSITAIESNAFESCPIENIDIPSSVKTISGNAFKNCKLIEVVLREGLKTMAGGCFAGNGDITEITLPSTLASLGIGVFNGCKLRKLYIPKDIQTFYTNAFEGCTYLEDVTLENGFNVNNVNLSYSTLYTVETILSWLEALEDGAWTRTLIIGAANLAKLTEEQIAIATAKNWTLA